MALHDFDKMEEEDNSKWLFTKSRILLIIMALFLVTLPLIYRYANYYFYIK